MLRRDALLASVQRRAARAVQDGHRTKSCCCRCIRSIPPPRPAVRLTAWREAAARVGLVARRHDAVLLSDRCRLHRRHSRPCCRSLWSRHGAELALRSRLRVLFSAHGLPEASCAKAIHINGRSSRPSRPFWPSGTAELGLGDLLPVARHAAAMARAQAPSTRSSVPRMTRSRCWWCRSRSCRSIRKPWSNWTWSIVALAERLGVPGYFRVPTQNADTAFIAALAGLVRQRTTRTGPGSVAASRRRAASAPAGSQWYVPCRR